MMYTIDILIFSTVGGREMLELFHWILDYYHPERYVIDVQPQNQNWLLLFKQPVTFSLDSGILEVPADYCILYTPGVRRHYYNNTAGYHHDGIFSLVFFTGKGILQGIPSCSAKVSTPSPRKKIPS